MRAFGIALLIGFSVASNPPTPQNFTALRCGVARFALQFAATKLPASGLPAVSDALNIDWLCANVSSTGDSSTTIAVRGALSSATARHASARAMATAVSAGTVATFFVATNGSDANPGTLSQPFLTLQRAALAVRGVSPRAPGDVTVFIRGGKYRLGATGPLALTAQDSNATWSAYPGDAAPVVLSGSLLLPPLAWSNYSGGAPGTLVAPVSIPDERAAAWTAVHKGDAAAGRRAGPPPLVASLFVNGTRQVRARWPNANPDDGSGPCIARHAMYPGECCAGWSSCAINSTGFQDAPPGVAVTGGAPNRGNSTTQGCAQCFNCGIFGYTVYPPPPDHPVYNAPLPGVGWPNASVFVPSQPGQGWGPWPSLFKRAAGFNVSTRGAQCSHWARAAGYAAPTGAVLAMFHDKLWGSWFFAVDNTTALPIGANETNVVFNVGYGGYQEGRGPQSQNGAGAFYVENVLEELDVPGEWFYDAAAGRLYLLPNSSLPALAAAELDVPVLDALVVVNGSAGGPYATGLRFVNLTFTASRITYLEQYEVPSGGYWAVHRGAALYVQDAEDVAVAGCTFDQVGGNALLFSNHVWHSAVTDSEFVRPGDSAVLLLGSTNGVDGSAPTYPNKNTIARNHMHEIGVYGKQTSCIGHMLSTNTTIADNVCYNGPRAGVNINDGFGGGNLFVGNIVFNMVRETGDHGPLNSWDRQPYLTFSGVDDGFADPRGLSIIRAPDLNTQNLMINGYSGVWTFDHDDCSQFVSDSGNFMVFGGCKNFLGNHKNCSDNVILYPGVWGTPPCQTDDDGTFADSYFFNNTCVENGGTYYSSAFGKCSAAANNLNSTLYHTSLNALLADGGGNFSQKCNQTLGWAEWQALGQDAGSVLGATPPVEDLIAMGAAKVLGA